MHPEVYFLPEINIDVASVDSCAEWAWVYEQYVRDVPGSFEFWMENMMDQSHVAFAHSGIAGNRSAHAATKLLKYFVCVCLPAC